MPTYHTLAQVEDFKEYIDSLVSIESNSKTSTVSLRPDKPISSTRCAEISRWIENEQVLCALDNRYWESRYAYICDEQGRIYKFKNRKSQEVLDAIISDFDERQVSIELLVLKARQVGMCLNPDTKILTADLEWKRIDDLVIGEEIVSVDEGVTLEQRRANQAKSVGDRRKGIKRVCSSVRNLDRKMRTAKIEAKWDVYEEAIRLTFTDGRILCATPEHKFLIKQRGGTDPRWQLTKHIGVGDEIRFITSTWTDTDLDDAWISGVLDGEGSLNLSKSGVEVKFTQVLNAVYDRFLKYVRNQGYSFQVGIDQRVPDPSQKTKLGSQDVGRISLARMDEVFKIIGKTRPVRFIGTRWWEGKSLPGKKSGIGWEKVIKIELLPRQRMIDIQTSTKTFIAEGFVSHNSTKTALKFIHRLMFVPHTQAVMASVQADKSELIGRILDVAYNYSPWWLRPGRLPKRAFDNGSILSIQSGMQATGIAQGWTPTCIHISELADIPNPQKTIEEGLLRATHSSRNLFMVFEGTGGGNTGWLADTWRSAKADYPKGRSRLCPIFIPWVTATDLYPEPDWIRKFPVPHDFTLNISDVTRQHVARCESYIRNTPYLARVCGSNWKMPIEQIWFWQFNYEQSCKNHTQKIWLAQMAADDYEALTGVHDSVFSVDTIKQLEENVFNIITSRKTGIEDKTRKVPVEAYAITGHDIDEAFYPSEEMIDDRKQILRIHWDSARGKEYEWQMIPLLPTSEDEEANTMDRLLIYAPPQRGSEYTLGIDTADGLGKEDEERTVLSLAKNRFHGQYDEQVAEFTSNRLNAAQAVAFAACIGARYSPYCPDSRGLMFAIEQVGRPGETCQHQLKMMGFHRHYRPKRFDSKKIKEEIGRKEGWWSSAWSVPILMTRFVEAVNGGWYIPKSRWLIEELRTLERRAAAGKSKMVHRSGQFDDRVRAAAQSFFCAHDLDVLADRAQTRFGGPPKDTRNPMPPRRAGTVSTGGWDDPGEDYGTWAGRLGW